MGSSAEGKRSVVRPFAFATGAVALATLIGLLLLWPGDPETVLNAGLSAPTDLAEVRNVEFGPCPPPQPGSCGRAEILIQSGPKTGSSGSLPLGSTVLDPKLEAGDKIRVQQVEIPPPAPGGEASTGYTFSDFERRSPMLWLAIAFVVLVVAFGRLRGALSLVGLAASLGLVVLFIVPAILDGSPPLLVAVVGSMAVMLLTIPLAHGLGPKSLAAALGTAVSLLLVAGLAYLFTELTSLTGLTSEELTLLEVNDVIVSFEGLLLAGMVIGALGVLDDVTVSQASTVVALRAANPRLGFSELYRRANDVGRDHVSATVNTLVLAYVGASLPVLLIFASGQLGIVEALNVELVAKEIVATLVGSIGLIAAVPITTALAARLALGLRGDELELAAAHGHVH